MVSHLRMSLFLGVGWSLLYLVLRKEKKPCKAGGSISTNSFSSYKCRTRYWINKNRYKVLDFVPPLILLKTPSEEQVECEIANIDKLFTVCAVLVNLGEGIVYNKKINNQD